MEKQVFYVYGDCASMAGWEYDYQTALEEEEGLKPLYKLVVKTAWDGTKTEEYLPTAAKFVDSDWIKNHPTYYNQSVYDHQNDTLMGLEMY